MTGSSLILLVTLAEGGGADQIGGHGRLARSRS